MIMKLLLSLLCLPTHMTLFVVLMMLLEGIREYFNFNIGCTIGLTTNFVKGMVKEDYGYMWDSEEFDPTTEPYKNFMTTPKEPNLSPNDDYYQSTSLVGMGRHRETSEAEGFSARTPTEGYTVYARLFTFTDMAEFSSKSVKSHQKIKDLTKGAAQEFGGGLKATRNTFYATAWNEGGKTAGHRYFNGTPESGAVSDSSGDGVYDGTAGTPVPWFVLTTGTARNSKGGGSYYNGFALTLDPDNLEAVLNYGASTNNRMENDERTTLPFDTLVVPTQLKFAAQRILNSTLMPGSMDNDTNVLNAIVNLEVWDYLTDTDAWFVGCKNRGIYQLVGEEPVIRFFYDERARTYCVTVEWSIGFVMRNWRFWLGSKFSAS